MEYLKNLCIFILQLLACFDCFSPPPPITKFDEQKIKIVELPEEPTEKHQELYNFLKNFCSKEMLEKQKEHKEKTDKNIDIPLIVLDKLTLDKTKSFALTQENTENLKLILPLDEKIFLSKKQQLRKRRKEIKKHIEKLYKSLEKEKSKIEPLEEKIKKAEEEEAYKSLNKVKRKIKSLKKKIRRKEENFENLRYAQCYKEVTLKLRPRDPSES